MRVQLACLDKNEAAKFASLIFIKDGKETYISSIINVFDNELVISLKDKSAHSVLLKDNGEVEKFADFIQSVLDGISEILETKASENIVEIEKG